MLYKKDNMTRKDGHKPVYAVMRVDFDMPSTSDSRDSSNPGIRFDKYSVTVKEIVTTNDEAQPEVERLNELNANKGCRYYWEGQGTFLLTDHLEQKLNNLFV